MNFVDCFGISDIGKIRQQNEDSFIVASFECGLRIHQSGNGFKSGKQYLGDQRGLLLAVADGMGGHAAGGYASELILMTICDFLLQEMNFFSTREASNVSIHHVLQRSVAIAHQALKDDVRTNPNRKTMGATLTMAIVVWPKAYIVHIGDSRCYLARHNELQLLTRDHTVARLRSDLQAGLAPSDQAMRFENVNWSDIKSEDALWNVIAANAEFVTPEIFEIDMQDGDVLMLCTDGLLRHTAERQILTALGAPDVAKTICKQLIDSVNRKGGIDNTTVIVAKFPVVIKGLKEICDQQISEESHESDTLDFRNGLDSGPPSSFVADSNA